MPEDFDLCRTEIETAVEVEPGSKLMAALIDRAVEVFSKAKKPVDRAPHTQYNYYEGANHFSGNQIKGVSIHAEPASQSLPQN